jgi:hypothetical protein
MNNLFMIRHTYIKDYFLDIYADWVSRPYAQRFPSREIAETFLSNSHKKNLSICEVINESEAF